MISRVRKKPEARKDLLEQAIFIARGSEDAASRFLEAAEAAFDLLGRRPEMGTACRFQNPQAVGIRAWSIRGFENHLIFYRPLADGIEVIRVLHAARDIDRIFGGSAEEE